MSETQSSAAQLRHTCLYDRHLALQAKMSPFAGFMMPIQYSSIVAEHEAVRTRAGMFDVSHMGEIIVSGKEAEAFVNYIFTNEISGCQAGKVLYGMMLRPDGGTVDDLLVYRDDAADGTPCFLLVVNAANIGKDVEWIQSLQRQRPGTGQPFDCTVVNVSDDWGQIAVQGPEAERVMVDVLHCAQAPGLEFYSFYRQDALIVSRTGYTGEDGFELYAPADRICDIWDTLLRSGVTPCGLGCRDTLRFEAGLPLYGHELGDGISPVMAGLGMFCKLDKAEPFVGMEALIRQKAEGTGFKLVGIELEDNAVPRAGYPVETADGEQVGEVTTGYHSITLDKSLCMALVRSGFAPLGTPLQVRIRKKTFPGRVVRKRFYTPNYKKS